MARGVRERAESLPSIFPGSWINGDFYIWIGHADDHRAWSQLVDARRALDARRPRRLRRSRWRGPGRRCSSPRAATGSGGTATTTRPTTTWSSTTCSGGTSGTSIGRSTSRFPRSCFVTNITTQPPEGGDPPPDRVHRAGHRRRGHQLLRMGRAPAAWRRRRRLARCIRCPVRQSGLTLVEFGFNLEHLFVRIDGTRSMTEVLAQGLEVSLNFLKPAGRAGHGPARTTRGCRRRSILERGGNGRSAAAGVLPGAGRGRRAGPGGPDSVRLPAAERPGAAVAFIVALHRGAQEIEHHPRHRADRIHRVPDRQFASQRTGRRKRSGSPHKPHPQIIHRPVSGLIYTTSHNTRYVN